MVVTVITSYTVTFKLDFSPEESAVDIIHTLNSVDTRSNALFISLLFHSFYIPNLLVRGIPRLSSNSCNVFHNVTPTAVVPISSISLPYLFPPMLSIIPPALLNDNMRFCSNPSPLQMFLSLWSLSHIHSHKRYRLTSPPHVSEMSFEFLPLFDP